MYILILRFFLIFGVGPLYYTSPPTENDWIQQEVYWTLNNSKLDISGKSFLIGALSFFLVQLVGYILL